MGEHCWLREFVTNIINVTRRENLKLIAWCPENKKRLPNLFNNYSYISLLSVTYKILWYTLLKLITPILKNEIIPKGLFWRRLFLRGLFRKIVWQIMERKLRYAHDTLRLFINFFQVYDNYYRKHVEIRINLEFSNK